MRVVAAVAALCVAALAGAGCSIGGTFGRDTRATKVLDASTLVVSNAMLLADAAYTTTAASQRWSGGREELGMPARQIMGATPSANVVMAYFAGAIAANTALWVALPPRWRSIIPGVLIGAQADALAYNYGICRSC